MKNQIRSVKIAMASESGSDSMPFGEDSKIPMAKKVRESRERDLEVGVVVHLCRQSTTLDGWSQKRRFSLFYLKYLCLEDSI